MAEEEKEEPTVRLEDLRLTDLLLLFLPAETRKHVLSARKEIFLAIKSLIDARIREIERGEERTTRAKKIDIE